MRWAPAAVLYSARANGLGVAFEQARIAIFEADGSSGVPTSFATRPVKDCSNASGLALRPTPRSFTLREERRRRQTSIIDLAGY